jgi:hypothetical protein
MSESEQDQIRLRALRRLPSSTLVEASIDPEVHKTLLHWKKSGNPTGILIGGIAMSFYAKPRYTQDIDVLFKSESHVPDSAQGFRKHRKGVFEDKLTGVEVEVVNPSSFNPPLSIVLVRKILDTASVKDGVLVASAEGLIALKLHAATNNPKRELQDTGDIANILIHQHHITLDTMSEWPLTQQEQVLLSKVLNKVRD